MESRILEGSTNEQVDLRVINVEGDLHHHNGPLEGKSLSELLQPIPDASHTRDRARSPPDSACQPGTRKDVVKWIVSWASGKVIRPVRLKLRRQHILWMYGYAGCGKSAIAQEISEQVHRGGRLLATFFFFRGAGDREEMGRLPNTLASQMAISLPKTARLIEAAVKAQPQLVQFEHYSQAESGLHGKSRGQAKSCFSLSARLQRLVYEPFKAVAARSVFASLSEPYLIIIDGLDECVDKKGVQEFITATLVFFEQNPSLPLRILITSRVEQHIHPHLSTSPGVLLKDLGHHCTREDIRKFMRTVFEAETKANLVVQTHIRHNGSWPDEADSEMLVDHIGGSFIFASTLFKFIFHGSGSPNDPTSPLERFPLALNIDPGLDGLYSQTLARSAHLPYFTDIISTLALIAEPLPISGIAELLEIQASAVAHVLVDLQAIIQVPGTDNAPVTFYHTSLRDFLTTESRSGQLFVAPTFHNRLLIGCLRCELRARRQTPNVPLDPRRQTAAVQYSLKNREYAHWGQDRVKFGNLESLIALRREMVELLPVDDRATGLTDLGYDLEALSIIIRVTATLGECISVHREALGLRPHPHPDRYHSLHNLGNALDSLFRHSKRVADIEESISVHREALSLCPHPHPDRHHSLNDLGRALRSLFDSSQRVADIEESISVHREALSLRPHPHPDRHHSLNNLGIALRSLFENSQRLADIEESILVHREALGLRPHPHRDRHWSLNNLGSALDSLFGHSKRVADIEESISVHREALSLRPHPHPDRHRSLNNLGNALDSLFGHSKHVADIEESISVHREALSLCPHPHPDRHHSLNNLGIALRSLFENSQRLADIEESILVHREALGLRPHPHRYRHYSLDNLGDAIKSLLEHRKRVGPQGDLCDESQSATDLDEAISCTRELLIEHYLEGHSNRDATLDNLESLLQIRLGLSGPGNQAALDEVETLDGQRVSHQ
ncbi:hypothetical protein MD484_g5769, partial [Candolleomyces efflorescens]